MPSLASGTERACTRRLYRAWQRSRCSLALLLLVACSVSAQSPRRGDRVTVRSGTALRGTPGGTVIGVSSRAITGTVESAQSTFVRILLEGHVTASDVRLTADRSRGEVLRANGTTMRSTASSSGAAVAELRQGTYVFPPQAGARFPRDVTFYRARRSLWVDVSRLASPNVAAARPAPAPARASPSVEERATAESATQQAAAPRPDSVAAPTPSTPSLETRGPTSMRTAPGGDVLASLPGGVPIATLARESGWVRVRLEGWIPDSAVDAAGSRSAGALSAADLRASPDAHLGRLVRWSVETLAFQTADELRRGLAPGERYLLARGPGDERAVLYLALPDSLVSRAQALPPLAELSITARVRIGRSEPAGVPILELLDFSRR